MESTEIRDWMTKEEAAAFVGKNDSFYLEKWKSHAETALKGWNWAAMFFGIEWMAYRKMYLEALLSVVAMFCISFVAALFSLNEDFVGYGVRILFGVFGNALYRKKALRILCKTGTQTESERLELLSRRGGVSPISVGVIIVLELVYGFLLIALLA